MPGLRGEYCLGIEVAYLTSRARTQALNLSPCQLPAIHYTVALLFSHLTLPSTIPHPPKSRVRSRGVITFPSLATRIVDTGFAPFKPLPFSGLVLPPRLSNHRSDERVAANEHLTRPRCQAGPATDRSSAVR
ncbi:hypothetical protein VFPFJ_08907 [Purpureocillium lilacinum]|uniref:Uncharacterized protein n=1 Tax=Purpureocillium lilacinum TaxID=33203 RepID=A0A179GYZ6_PURLI|nr:hypothetical protein VFPFJ_08907 [Purpureocillium lilacinum]OAQ74990.1 hypothetical protein VFPBJ_10285 [Purpureocillium lilacinum]OAQ83104.1 hypothetical protein VFPFJ_08907 [Purpureocillium lilacinum]